MTNQITMGQNRKLKKKLKKLKKTNPENPDKVFRDIQKYKSNLFEIHQKKLFNPAKEMEKRREKRRDKMDSNRKKRKQEIRQQNMDRFD